MRHFRILIGIIGILSFSFVPTAFAQIKIGQSVPNFVTSTLDGQSFTLKDYLKNQKIKF